MPKALSHISSLKHVIDLKLERSADVAKSTAGANGGAVQFACPITGQALNGKYKFVMVRRTGHVLSERALKEVRLQREGLGPAPEGGYSCYIVLGTLSVWDQLRATRPGQHCAPALPGW